MPAPPNLRVSPHSDRVVLDRDAHGDSWLLHLVTCERVHLGAASFGIGHDAEGFAFVGTGAEDTMWAENVLKVKLLKSSGAAAEHPEEKWVQHAGEIQELITFWDKKSGELKVVVDTPPFRQSVLSTYRWFHPFGCCAMDWCLPDLYKTLNFKSFGGLAGKWSSHSWPSWLALLGRLGLPSSHLRLQLERIGTQRVGLSSEITERLLGKNSMSTIMLVALLAVWSGKGKRPGPKHSDEDKIMSGNLLEALLGLAFKRNPLTKAKVFIDEDAKWEYPKFPEGIAPVLLPVNGMEVDLSSLAPMSCNMARQVMRALPMKGPKRYSFAELLQHLGSEKTHWLWRQLVWMAGQVVDDYWVEQVDSGEVGLHELTKVGAQMKLMQYFLGHAKELHKPTFLSGSIDLARVGYNKRAFGVLAVPAGHAMVYPPQVFRST